jgi:predicted nucleotidyltransferase
LEKIRHQLAEKSTDLKRFKVAKLSIFGSAARGASNVNDLDFLVEFSEPPGLMDFMGLKFLLEEVFQMPVDLHSQASCPERFYKRIQADLKHVA